MTLSTLGGSSDLPGPESPLLYVELTRVRKYGVVGYEAGVIKLQTRLVLPVSFIHLGYIHLLIVNRKRGTTQIVSLL